MKFSFPHPMVILLGFIVLAALGVYLIPSGEFDRIIDPLSGREVVVPGSFHAIEDVTPSLKDILLAIPEGIIAGADILVLILFIGGAFYIVEKTGALQLGIENLFFRFKSSKFILIYLLGVVFAFGGAAVSMQEEIIPMVPILILLATKLNYDLRSIIAITFGSSMIGAAFSPFNPFVGLLAQNIGEVIPFSGFGFRSTALGLILFSWITFHLIQGKKSNPSSQDVQFKPSSLTLRDISILFLAFGGFGLMAFGIIQWDWSYTEMSALFFVIGMACGIIAGKGLNGTARLYVSGFGEMIFAGVIVGLARSIYLILEKGAIIDSIIQGLFSPLENLPNALAITGMFISQALIHIPVPSTSGQAVLTIPLAAPLTELLGISRQVAVLAYQLPAALMDMLSPTNGGMMAIIAAGGLSYKDWISYIWKSWIMITLICLGITLLGILWF